MSTTEMRRRARDTNPLGRLEGVTVLHCDEAGCAATIHGGLIQNRGGTRLAAQAYGWTYVKASKAFRDLCPAHKPTAQDHTDGSTT